MGLNNIVIKIIAEDLFSRELEAVNKTIDSTLKNISSASAIMPKEMSKASFAAKNLGREFKTFSEVMEGLSVEGVLKENITAPLDEASEKVKKLNMRMLGFGLSMLFTGMALKRLASGAGRALVTTFMSLADETNSTVKDIMAVDAAFKFLKFSIMDTLGQTDLFQSIVSWLIGMANSLSQFVQQHPQLAKLIGIFIVAGIILGSVGMILGQLVLLGVGLGLSLLPVVGIILLISMAVAALFVIWDSDFSTATKLIFSIITALLTTAGIIALIPGGIKLIGTALAWLANNPIVWLILAFIGIIIILGNMVSAVGGFGNFFKAVFAGLLKILIRFGLFLVDSILLPLYNILDAAASLADFIGADSIAAKLGTIANAIYNVRGKFLDAARAATEFVDVAFGMDKIREENTALQGSSLSVLGAMVTGKKQSPMPTEGQEEYNTQIEEQKTSLEDQKKTLEELGGGASLKDIEEIGKESDLKLAELVELQKEQQKKEDERKDGYQLLSESLGISVEQGILRALANKTFNDTLKSSVEE